MAAQIENKEGVKISLQPCPYGDIIDLETTTFQLDNDTPFYIKNEDSVSYTMLVMCPGTTTWQRRVFFKEQWNVEQVIKIHADPDTFTEGTYHLAYGL